jgi:hypothetical protein
MIDGCVVYYPFQANGRTIVASGDFKTEAISQVDKFIIFAGNVISHSLD